MGRVPVFQGDKYVLIIVYHSIKWYKAVALTNQKAKSVAFGSIVNLQSDQMLNFLSKKFRILCSELRT